MPQLEKYPAHAVNTYTAEGTITKGMALVEGTADGQAKAPGGADVGAFVGFAMHDAASGEQVQVAGPGCYARAISDGTVTRGAQCAIQGTSGKLKAVTTADTYVVAQACTAGAVDGDTVFVLVVNVNNT